MDVDGGSSSTDRIRASQTVAAKAEREAADRITAARKRVVQAELESQKELEQQRDSFEKRADVERIRSADSLEQQRSKGYEQIRETKRLQTAEESRIRRDGEKQTITTKDHYDHAITESESRGERTIKELEKKNYTQQEFQRRQGNEQIKQLKEEQTQLQENLHANRVNTHDQLTLQAQVERKTLEASTRDAIQNSQDHYEKLYVDTTKNQHGAMDDLNWKAGRELEKIRHDTAHRLDAYSSRQSDPFYKLVDLKANFVEHDDQFVLKVNIPEYEQKHISVSIRGNEVVVSGNRRNEEKLELEPGKNITTSAYQSYSKSFPLNWPVNPKNLTREFDGDQLIIRIPKKTTYEPPAMKRTASRAVVERPNFPSNLPGEKELASLDKNVNPESDVPPSKRTPGYKPLS